MGTLRDTLVGYAEWLGYGHGERADAWLARLDINRPEMSYFSKQAVPACAAYCAMPASLAPADGDVHDMDRSRQIRAAEAAAVLERAKQHADFNIFTWLPDSVHVGTGGLLAGMPVVIKDLMSVKGAPLSGGSMPLSSQCEQRDAEVVDRLRRAGATIIGTTNLHELAYGITSDNPHFGRVINPVANSRIPGGSSGGSAAAIAAGIVSAAIGTDTAGSIRVPAACCGIVGFKPSYDAVPRAGVMDLAPSLDHVGPMGRSVHDCALLFAAMLDLSAMPAWRYRSLSGCGIARLTGYFEDPLDPAVKQALHDALDACAADGAVCSSAEVIGIEAAPATQFNSISPEAMAANAQRLAQHGDELGEDVRVRLEVGHFLPGHWYVKAQKMRRQLADEIDALFQQTDFLICPTMRVPAPAVGASRISIGEQTYALHTAVTQLTLPFNLTGLPAISVPWSMTTDGVPIGLQIVGRRGSDWQVLALAERLEQLSPWAKFRFAAGHGKDGDAGT